MSGIAPLLEGYRRFRNGGWPAQRERWAELAEGQSPKVMVIGCADSRVDPSQIFDMPPGELFVVRNVANLVPPFETGGGHHGVSAALEFAVTQLNVTDIVVLGHGACGGVRASLDHAFADAPPGEGGFIADWVSLLADARDQVVAAHGSGGEAAHALEHAGIGVSLANLRTFPFVPDREASGKLRLHGAWFAIAEGRLHLRDPATGAFEPLED